MLKRTLSLIALSLLFISCNQKDASKITDGDMKIVEEEIALIGKFPKVELDKIVHDFGTIKEGDVVETEFMVKNIGETDLIIADAKGSCGCTVPEPPKEPIKPGDSAPIKVSFDSNGKPGQQSKTVTLTTNTEAGKETFEIKATVTPKTK
jgi:hypothetical protein